MSVRLDDRDTSECVQMAAEQNCRGTMTTRFAVNARLMAILLLEANY